MYWTELSIIQKKYELSYHTLEMASFFSNELQFSWVKKIKITMNVSQFDVVVKIKTF
uniref:Uncharacterized protein n=1 Tax=Anguilla anguilla TaxID=7936 RepID=A0A0E9UQW4_ANGAN